MKTILTLICAFVFVGFCNAANEPWYPGKILVVEPAMGITNAVIVKPSQNLWQIHKKNQKIRQENIRQLRENNNKK